MVMFPLQLSSVRMSGTEKQKDHGKQLSFLFTLLALFSEENNLG